MPKTKFEFEIINLVKSQREVRDLSQEDIASILKVSRGFIGQIESINSSSRYTYNQLNTLAVAFNCSPKDFMPQQPIINNKSLMITKPELPSE